MRSGAVFAAILLAGCAAARASSPAPSAFPDQPTCPSLADVSALSDGDDGSALSDGDDGSALSDGDAAQAVRAALASHRRSAGLPDLVEDVALARGLAKSVKLAAEAQSVRDRPVPYRLEAQFFFFTTPDPLRLPVLVASMSEGARSSAVAATFHRSAEHPNGIYWVALALE